MNHAYEILLDHARNPRNQFLSPSSTAGLLHGECKNPLCGDHVELFVSLDNQSIRSCHHRARGCAVCTASSSLMCMTIQALNLSEAIQLKQLFEEMLTTATEKPWPLQLEGLKAFAHLRQNPSRMPCALIPWQALQNIILFITENEL